jgi:circadian clock protein KaiB
MSKAILFKFRLYLAGDAPNSTQAVLNLKSFCVKHLPDRYEIEMIDVICEPQRALADGVLLTPMVVRVSPGPVRRIIGNLSEQKPLLRLLE